MGKTRAQVVITPAYLSLKDTAAYLGIGLSTSKRDWPSWEKFGVIPSRYVSSTGRGRRLFFRRTELDRMMDQMKVIKPGRPI